MAGISREVGRDEKYNLKWMIYTFMWVAADWKKIANSFYLISNQ